MSTLTEEKGKACASLSKLVSPAFPLTSNTDPQRNGYQLKIEPNGMGLNIDQVVAKLIIRGEIFGPVDRGKTC